MNKYFKIRKHFVFKKGRYGTTTLYKQSKKKGVGK